MDSFESYTFKESKAEVSNRKFGFTFAAIFLLLAPWLYYKHSSKYPYFLMLSLLTLIMTLKFPNILAPFNKAWMHLGLLLKKITSPVILIILFYAVITPTGLILRLLKKDILNLKINKNETSYWISKFGSHGTLKDQF